MVVQVWEKVRTKVRSYPAINRKVLEEQLFETMLPSMVDEIVQMAKHQSETDLNLMEKAAREQDWKKFGDLAHKMKGTILVFGCEQAGQYCHELMRLRLPENNIKDEAEIEEVRRSYFEMVDMWKNSFTTVQALIEEWKQEQYEESEEEDESEDDVTSITR